MLHASSSPVGKHLLLVVTSCFGTAVGATLRHRCVGLITLACGICGIFCLVRFGFSHELRHWQTGFPCADGVWCLTGVQQHDFLAKSWLEAYGWQAQKKSNTDMSDMLHSITLLKNLKMIGCPFSGPKKPIIFELLTWHIWTFCSWEVWGWAVGACAVGVGDFSTLGSLGLTSSAQIWVTWMMKARHTSNGISLMAWNETWWINTCSRPEWLTRARI